MGFKGAKPSSLLLLSENKGKKTNPKEKRQSQIKKEREEEGRLGSMSFGVAEHT